MRYWLSGCVTKLYNNNNNSQEGGSSDKNRVET